MSPLTSPKKGFTLVELLITVALFGIFMSLGRLGIIFLNNAANQNSRMGIQSSAQSIVFNITRDIRNSKDILDVGYDHLVLSAFNLSAYSYSSPSLFSPVNIGTVTYQYQNGPSGGYIERTTVFPTHGGLPAVQKLLVGMVLPPDTTNFLFLGGPSLTPPYDSVELTLRLKSGVPTDPVIVYDETAVKRAARQ